MIKAADEIFRLQEENKELRAKIDALNSDDCISRQAVIDMTGLSNWFESSDDYNNFVGELCKLPPITSTKGICKDCRAWRPREGERGFCRRSPHIRFANESCENFEKRGELDGSN